MPEKFNVGERVLVPTYHGRSVMYVKEGTVTPGTMGQRRHSPNAVWVLVDGQVEPYSQGFDASVLRRSL